MQMMSTDVLLIDDDDAFREVYNELLTEEGYVVHQAHDVPTAQAAFAKHKPTFVILDLMLPPSGRPQAGAKLCDAFLASSPSCKVITISGTGDTQTALATVRAGAYDFLTKPIEPDVLFAVLTRAQVRMSLEKRVEALQTVGAAQADGGGFLGESQSFVEAKLLCKKVAPTDVPILITGATGTGKEVAARYIHECSNRSAGPFIAVNCGALHEGLLESTLFGHKKGAFTGAVQDNPGLFVAAAGGTLFLDEIGDTAPNLQVKLLRALEAQEVLALGATQATPTNVRIVSATHQPLMQRIAEGTFREDLFWRIRGIEVALPSLKNRKSDLKLLAACFLNQARALVPGAQNTQLSAEAFQAMESYSWPGNLRELRHEMQRGLVMAGAHPEVLASDLSPALCAANLSERTNLSAANVGEVTSTLESKLAQLERSEIVAALQATAGNKSKAAQRLGVSRQGLLNKITRHNIA